MDIDRMFNALYHDFIIRGGFSLPCIDEWVERRARQMIAHQPTICPHGKSLLLCDVCYFGKENGWGRA
jgi:hypothetical protein